MNTINKLIIGGIFLTIGLVALFGTATVALACSGSNHSYLGCHNNNVYWFDSCDWSNDVYQQCATDQVCQNAQCVTVNIDCYDKSDCQADEATGGPFCQGNNVYQNYFVATCNNPGTTSSFCSDSTVARLQTTCTGSQTCSSGSCTTVNIACSTNSQCGTNGLTGSPFCQGGSVYQNYKTYTCNNPGTSSSSCTNATTPQLQTTCTANQTCSNGSCSNVNIACSTDAQCGTNGLTGGLFCQSNNVYQNYKTYTCNSPGTSSSYCSNVTAAQLQTTCTGSQTCSNGSCSNTCTQNYQQRCVGTSMYWFDSCGVQGTYVGTCGNSCTQNYQQRCVGTSMYWFDSCGVQGTYVGTCGNSCTQNYQQRCLGNSMYWYDSCGVQGSYVGTCGNNTNTTLTVTKTVRDLTTNTTFANSTYANPSDTLMFMITLQASGNQDAQSVYVRDVLPSNLIYTNQLVVARTNNSYDNYTGDIISGLSLGTITAGQTVTVTYQTQVAQATNFTFGTTTLNNLVNTTSSNVSYIPTATASVIVTRAGVLGASTVSTGITNNFWVDSFFLPLLMTIIAIWMWRSGMFFGIEKWLDRKRKVRRGYQAEKELSARIAKLQKK